MRRGFSSPLEAVGKEADGVVILGVHHDQRAGLARHAHDVEHFEVGERQPFVGHEHLERGVAVVDQSRQLLAEHAFGRIGNDQVERDVDVAMAVGLGMIGRYHLAEALAFLLHGERQHHGVAAERGRAATGGKIVGHDHAGAGRLRQMNVAVDAARKYEFFMCIDDGVRCAKIVAQRRDPPAADADIAVERVRRCSDRAAADDGVEAHADTFSIL